MPVDLTTLNETIAALAAQVSQTVGTEDSAETLLAGFSAAIKTAVTAAVNAALTADAAANAATISAVNDAIAGVTAQFATSSGKLGQAIVDNPLPTA